MSPQLCAYIAQSTDVPCYALFVAVLVGLRCGFPF